MSIAQIQTNNLLDLIPAKPISREPANDTARAGAGSQERGGFDQTLQESASPRGGRASDAGTERGDRGRSEGVEARPADASQDNATDGPAEQDPAAPSAESAQPDDKPEPTPDQAGTQEQASAEDTAQSQAGVADDESSQVARALAAQVAATTQGVVQAGATTTDPGDAGDAEAEAAAKQAAAVAAATAAGQAQAHTTTQASTAQATTATTTVVQPLQQQDTADQTNQDNGRGGNTAGTAQAQSAPSATGAQAASASAAFTVADPSAGDARLPINTTPSTQQASAALQAQQPGAAGQDDGDALNTARLTRGLANAVQQRGGAVTLRLTPPEMGTVRIQMNITGTNVSASFHAESASAQTLLTQQLAQLRTSLEGQGMSVERLTVQPLTSTSAGQNAGQSQNDGQQQNQQQNAANDGRSRGQYSGDASGGRSDGGRGDEDAPTQQHQQRGFFDQLGDAAEQADA